MIELKDKLIDKRMVMLLHGNGLDKLTHQLIIHK